MRPNDYTEAVLPPRNAVSNQAEIDWYAFLERPRLPSPTLASLEKLRGASILVTGAGGSIGSALSLQLAALGAGCLTLLDASEQALSRLKSKLEEAALPGSYSLALGSVQDSKHLDEILEEGRPQFIFHAAAHKHVPLLEEHPLAAIANNALGTFTLIESARRAGDARVILLSTDKAVAPVSILGASKRIAEQVTLVSGGVVLRLGNVLSTEGSVAEIFLHQIGEGLPLTIHHPAAERYFLTIEEAADLLIAAATAAPAGSLLAPLLNRQYRVTHLAEFLASQCKVELMPAMTPGELRPGDKLREALWSSEEQPRTASLGQCGYFEIEHHPADRPRLRQNIKHLEDAVNTRDFASTIEIVLAMVPDYAPSKSIQAQLQKAHQEAIPR